MEMAAVGSENPSTGSGRPEAGQSSTGDQGESQPISLPGTQASERVRSILFRLVSFLVNRAGVTSDSIEQAAP